MLWLIRNNEDWYGIMREWGNENKRGLRRDLSLELCVFVTLCVVLCLNESEGDETMKVVFEEETNLNVVMRGVNGDKGSWQREWGHALLCGEWGFYELYCCTVQSSKRDQTREILEFILLDYLALIFCMFSKVN